MLIDSISPEAKAAAQEAGLDNNGSALKQIAREKPEVQVAKVTEIKETRAQQKKPTNKSASEANPTLGLDPSRERGDLRQSAGCHHWAEKSPTSFRLLFNRSRGRNKKVRSPRNIIPRSNGCKRLQTYGMA